MFGINEIIGKVFSKKPLTEEEKFRILHSKRIDPKVIEYLMKKLNNLYIEVLGDYYETYKENHKNEIVVTCGPENPNTSLYRNSSGYRAELENGKIKKLTAHFYDQNG